MEKFKLPLRLLYLLLFVLSTVSLPAQQISISGTVSDSSGEPLIGASVTVPGTKIGAATDIDGNFSLTADAKSTLHFSYVGYKSQDVAVNGRTTINVVMEENSEVLDEVVVVGYGTMDKKELTSAISHVSEKDFLTVSTLDPSMMIQGKVPGVSITNTGSGRPEQSGEHPDPWRVVAFGRPRSADCNRRRARRQPHQHQSQRHRVVRHP